MDTRSLLIAAVVVLSFLLWQEWEKDHVPTVATNSVAPIAEAQNSDVPTVDASSDVPTPSSADIPSATTSNRIITVATDVLKIAIDLEGGDVVSAALLAYPKEQHKPGDPITLLQHEAGRSYIAQSGLISAAGQDIQGKRPLYQATQTTYTLTPEQDSLTVDLNWQDPNGLQITKRYRFSRSQYLVSVEYQIHNATPSPLSLAMYSLLKRDRFDTQQSNSMMGISTYLGGAFGTQDEKYEKYSFSDMDSHNLNKTTQGGWVAMLQHYFLAAWVTPTESDHTLYSLTQPGKPYRLGIKQANFTVAPNGEATTKAELYLGPKIQSDLAKIAPGLDLTVDYGILFLIGQPLFWLLKWFYSLVSNWGVAIILVTIVVKVVFYPLSRAQYRSAAKMRKLQPKLEQLKQRVGDDKQKLSQEMLELYRKEKVNPLGGCLPLLVQMPVFIALYWVLLESVELRHAKFFGWITDLSVQDPYFILPVLMGISMFIMQKMTPTPPSADQTMIKVMQYMPVMMTVFFLFFPAGLVLYWFVSNVISIAQQWYITKTFHAQA